jgi:hypothetical protein
VSRTASEAPSWDLTFLRVGVLATLALTAVAAPVVGLLAGWPDALGVVVGAVVVAFFFCVSGLVITWAGRVHDSFTLPAALGSFAVKVLLLFPVLNALPADGWLDRRTFALTVVAGALLWSVVQGRWVWTRQLYYVTPPARPGASPADAGPDPEIGRTRG